MMKNTKLFYIVLFFLFLTQAQEFFALSLTDAENALVDIFYSSVDGNEGTTNFRSLLIPFGGRTESLGEAFTGLCDDINYLRYNPAAGSLQGEGQIAVFHNSWIADSKLDTLAFTTRFAKAPNLSMGAFISCFYLPFTEYDSFGSRVSSGYYSETTAALNISYNFFSGYDFKGLALGANLKAAWRGMPDYTDDDTGLIIASSGLSQSALAVMADAGLMMQFNFLKFYSSREPNVRVGFSAQNFGVAFTGFSQAVTYDDALPATLAAGISVRFIKPFTLAADFSQPINLQEMQTYLLPAFSIGLSIQFTNFLQFLVGTGLKGGNPHINAGFEFEISKVRVNMNYTLDFTTSLAPFNKFSLSAKFLLGDKGRLATTRQVDEYYASGLQYYSEGQWEKAIESWEEALKLNKRFTPAILGIKSASSQLKMMEMIKNSLKLDRDSDD